MFDMNGFLAHESLPGLWSKNFYAPLFIGVSFLAMGSYIRVYDDEEASKLFGFGLLCLILGACCVVLSICWFMFEYKDRQELLNRRARANYLNRNFFLNLRHPSSQSNVNYPNYLTARRRSARWYEIQRLDAQQLPSYQEAICTGLSQPSFIRLPHATGDFCSRGSCMTCCPNNCMNGFTNGGFIGSDESGSGLVKCQSDKAGQVGSADFSELSVPGLRGVLLSGNELPSYEEAIKMDESNECTKL